MAKKQPHTPRSQVRSALRLLWLRSRERAAALKREGYCCEICSRKQSKAKGREIKIEVHHLNEMDWEKLIDYVFRHLLCDSKDLEVLCEDCHEKEHKQKKAKL